ncbi:MAG: class I SAM-dependent methyltransferase [Betaproteobacteria bacterium]|nr:SAM-dependent methyltransferase [Rubrivivax sp.]
MAAHSGVESVSVPPFPDGPAALKARIAQAVQAAGGWLPFDRFMALALYEPGLGYYARGAPLFGTLPQSGSDFVTAPELSPLFGATLARAVGEALDAAAADTVVEFGAGSGALAAQLLGALGGRVRRYRIVELSAALRQRQQQRLAAFAGRVEWLDAWPETLHAVVVGNEVLDAMPVTLLHFDGSGWSERGVALQGDAFAWADRPSTLRPPHAGPFVPGTTTEIHPQAEAFVRGLAERLARGAVFLVDYGFPEHEYYHPQRLGGTLMCHRAHRADADPLADVGTKDITAHVNFSALALAAQDAGLDVLGYTTQARFLYNAGIAELLQAADLPARAMAARLVNEHEMGELFKVLMLGRGLAFGAAGPLGFVAGDRSHTL